MPTTSCTCLPLCTHTCMPATSLVCCLHARTLACPPTFTHSHMHSCHLICPPSLTLLAPPSRRRGSCSMTTWHTYVTMFLQWVPVHFGALGWDLGNLMGKDQWRRRESRMNRRRGG